MHHAGFHATRFTPALHVPPAPAAHSGLNRREQLPRIVVTRPTSRRRSQLTSALTVGLACGIFLGAGLAVMLPAILRHATAEQTPPERDRHQILQSEPMSVARGQGKAGQRHTDTRPVRSISLAQVGAIARQEPPAKDIDISIDKALQACRDGRFDDADGLGSDAMRLAPRDPRGQAVRLLAAYVRQYPDLADHAVDAMNGTVEVDLGRRYGVGAFVERAGDEIVFLARGRHERFTVGRFNSLDGVRFRVTRQFLENGRQPANDLILGAVHFVQQRDETGAFQADGSGVHQAAQARWTAASRSTDPLIADHARALLSLLDESGKSIATTGKR
jgi:hypothetical protein